MNLEQLQRKLLAVARANPPRQDVPYAFEQRVVARLTPRVVLDDWAFWSRGLWRATAPCVAIMRLFGTWAVLAPQSNSPTTDVSQEFENTVLAAADQVPVSDSTW